jgi:hypothetical protein
MILAREVACLTKEGKHCSIAAYTPVKNIKPASDHGFWFDFHSNSFGKLMWKRVWAAQVPILMD